MNGIRSVQGRYRRYREVCKGKSAHCPAKVSIIDRRSYQS